MAHLLEEIECEDLPEFTEEEVQRAELVDFFVDRETELPVGMQLDWKIRAMVASGVLRPDDRLPSVRELAELAEINVKTARAVYAKLEARGLIASKHGRGTFVAANAGSSSADAVATEALRWADEAGVDAGELAIAVYAASGRGPSAENEMHFERIETGRKQPPTPVELPDTEFEDDAALRRELRRQIGRLEVELAAYTDSHKGTGETRHPLLRPKGHVAGVEELEMIRSDLTRRLAASRAAAERRGEREELARGRIEEMIRDPERHRWEIVTSDETGDVGCKNWRVVPKYGPAGAIMGWWRVKVSSGCPLAGPLEAAPNIL